MIIGIPREVKEDEYRVAMTPAGVRELTAAGHTVHVEKDAGDGSALPDSAFVATMLGEVPEPLRALAELRRVLRPGGVASFAETRRDSDFYSPSKLIRLVERCGFKFLSRRGLRWQYVANFAAT